MLKLDYEKMADPSQYSIWLIPDNKTRAILSQVIEEIAGKYKTPVFEPHATLLGSIEEKEKVVIEKTKKLALKTQRFPVIFGKVEFSTTYFQCVFVRINTNAPLMNLHVQAQKLFGGRKDYVFMPHISLVYGNFSIPEREKITGEITLPQLSFIAKTLRIIPNLPNPKDWQPLAEINLR